LTTELPAIYSQTAVVIPAAGNSVRMGSHKALLRFDEKYNFIQKIVSVYAEVGLQKLIVVVNKNNADAINASLNAPEYGNVHSVLNKHPERERFYSIKCGLEKVSGFEKCFIHNCDNPYVDTLVIRKLLEGFTSESVTLPEYLGKRGHPVLLSRDIIQAAISDHENSCNFKEFLSKFKSTIISVDNKTVLYNINSKLDYKAFYPFSDLSGAS
jgi:molybdenum cofactor cytidylyltransferase